MKLLTPLSSLRISRHHIPAYSSFPNTSLSTHPLTIYHSAFLPPLSQSSITSHLEFIGVVSPQWVYTMYTEPHFHSTTHELLVVLTGSAKVQFGGPSNPGRIETTVTEGDVMIIPAGVAHALLGDLGGFKMIGCYPVNAAQWDHCVDTGKKWDIKMEERIKGLSWFERDPIFGDEGAGERS